MRYRTCLRKSVGRGPPEGVADAELDHDDVGPVRSPHLARAAAGPSAGSWPSPGSRRRRCRGRARPVVDLGAGPVADGVADDGDVGGGGRGRRRRHAEEGDADQPGEEGPQPVRHVRKPSARRPSSNPPSAAAASPQARMNVVQVHRRRLAVVGPQRGDLGLDGVGDVDEAVGLGWAKIQTSRTVQAPGPRPPARGGRGGCGRRGRRPAGWPRPRPGGRGGWRRPGRSAAPATGRARRRAGPRG